jgi:hypothetical protein
MVAQQSECGVMGDQAMSEDFSVGPFAGNDWEPKIWDGLGEPPIGHKRWTRDGWQEWRGKRLGWQAMPKPGDKMWDDASEYEWTNAYGWRATGIQGEPLGSRDRDRGYMPAHDTARLPTDSAKRKEAPIYSGPLRYFPDALAEVAKLCKAGNDKHNPGEPLHWSRSKSDDHLDCLARHLLEAGTLDADGFYHDVKVAWRALTNLQVLLERVRGLPISPGSKP